MTSAFTVAQSFTLPYRSQSATVRRRKNRVADRCSAPLPIRWGEGKDLGLGRLRPSAIDRSQKLSSLAPSDGERVRERGDVHLPRGRFSICNAPANTRVQNMSRAVPTASRRYSRVKLCVTSPTLGQATLCQDSLMQTRSVRITHHALRSTQQIS